MRIILLSFLLLFNYSGLVTSCPSSGDGDCVPSKDTYNKNSNILGIHLEGPFINPDKLGAQPNLTQIPSQEFIFKLLKLAKIKIITLAPEIKGMNEFISFLSDLKIKVHNKF